MSKKICPQCCKPHNEVTKMCEACKAYARTYQRRRVLLAKATGERRCTRCRKQFDEPHNFHLCNACRGYNQGYNKKRREEHHEATLAYNKIYCRAWRKKNPTWFSNYQKENPEQFKVYNHNRNAAKRENGGTFTFKELNEQFERQEGFCYYCGELLYKSFDSSVHIDHMTPISRGGSNDISNIALSCATCNLKKHAKTAEEFMEMIK
jgi:hypothetical protein